MATIPNEVVVTKFSDSTDHTPGVWCVTLNEARAGSIERYRDSVGLAFPWVAKDRNGRILDTFPKYEGYENAVNEVVRRHFQTTAAEAVETKGKNIVQRLTAYENDEYNHEEEVELFRDLLTTGIINHLQGSYQRRALQLVTDGELP